MSETTDPRKLAEVLPVLSDDPPPLRAMLLAAGEDMEVKAEISRAYWSLMEGSQFSPSVLHGILLSAIYNAISTQAGQFRPSDNGAEPHSEHLEATRAEIEALAQIVRGMGESTSKLERRWSLVGDSLKKIEDRVASLDEVTTTFAGVARQQLYWLIGAVFMAGFIFWPVSSVFVTWLRGVLHF